PPATAKMPPVRQNHRSRRACKRLSSLRRPPAREQPCRRGEPNHALPAPWPHGKPCHCPRQFRGQCLATKCQRLSSESPPEHEPFASAGMDAPARSAWTSASTGLEERPWKAREHSQTRFSATTPVPASPPKHSAPPVPTQRLRALRSTPRK